MKSSRRPIAIVVAVAAVFALSACESDPSPTRVATDLVKTETADEPEVQECMLGVIDDYDLDTLGEESTGDNAEEAEAADVQLAEFEADLAACR